MKITKLDKDSYNSILNQSLKNIQEERDLALDRYRAQDLQITQPSDFVLQGKEIVAFLKLASERTNMLLEVAKEIKEIAYLEELRQKGSSAPVTGEMTDKERAEIEMFLKNNK